MSRNEVSASILLDALIEGIFASASMTVIDGSFYEQLADVVDPTSTDPLSPEALVAQAFSPSAARLLDFGCGTGGHRAMLESFGYDWRGVNYREGMAAGARDAAAADPRIDFYDGLRLACYDDATFDVVYSYQTFEHIQDIPTTFAELHRILAPRGKLIGAVSYLEQFHDYSTFNFTPYGLKLAAENAGMRLSRIYPSYDVFTWLVRRLLVATSGSDENSLTQSLSRNNKIHDLFISNGQKQGLSIERINLFRLKFSSHITFLIEKQ